MFVIVVLLLVGSVSFAIVRTIQHGSGHRHLIGIEHGDPSTSWRTAVGALKTTTLTVAVFIPLMVIAYVTIALVRLVFGQ